MDDLLSKSGSGRGVCLDLRFSALFLRRVTSNLPLRLRFLYMCVCEHGCLTLYMCVDKGMCVWISAVMHVYVCDIRLIV